MLTRSGSSFRSLIRWQLLEMVFCSFAVELLLSRGCSFLSCKSTFLLPRLDPWQHLSVVCDLNFVFPASGAMFNRSLILKMSRPPSSPPVKSKVYSCGRVWHKRGQQNSSKRLDKGFFNPYIWCVSILLHSSLHISYGPNRRDEKVRKVLAWLHK